jgi:D-alanine transfer protein
MRSAAAQGETPHLFAGLIACLLVTAIVCFGGRLAVHLEYRTLSTNVSEVFPQKNQGLAFQRAAVHGRNVLPLYGSSELLKPIPDKSSDFFRTAPTGFRVSPVGKAGTTSLIVVQKVGALGPELRGKKIAISLSPSWFLIPALSPHFYEGNFSLLAANEMTFGGAFDFALKRDIAARMLRFPDSLAKSPLLNLALQRLISDTWLDRIVFCALWPMGKLQTTVLRLQDHFEALIQILTQAGSMAPALHRETIDWPKLTTEANKVPNPNSGETGERFGGWDEETLSRGGEAAFLARMHDAREWADFELLLRGLAETHARPLLLSMPIDGPFFDQAGISRSAREVYYSRIRTLAQRYDFPLVDFVEHDSDPAFLEDHHYHLTAKGWTFYNRALDDFFHDRLPGT